MSGCKLSSGSVQSSQVPVRFDPVLPELRVRNLVGLLLYTTALLVAAAVLLAFAQGSNLRQRFFTYRADVNIFGDTASISPFSIIPTLLSVVLSLWWGSIDNACRALQPFLNMSSAARKPSEGAGLTYVSTFWLWASYKAAKHRNWLLSLITMATFMIPIRVYPWLLSLDSSKY